LSFPAPVEGTKSEESDFFGCKKGLEVQEHKHKEKDDSGTKREEPTKQESHVKNNATLR